MSELVPGWIGPYWGRTGPVRVLTTTRVGGVDGGSRPGFDLGHDEDGETPASPDNRRRLRTAFDLPAEPCWLRQEHGMRVIEVDNDPAAAPPVADGAWTASPGVVCAVLTADCLPIVLADPDGAAVGVLHAGWRGLAAGVIEAMISAIPVEPPGLRAWLGPAIGPHAFEVGPEVRDAFLAHDPAAATAFVPGRGDRWWADLYTLARQRLRNAGVTDINGGEYCTFSEPERFFSWRREGARTGRMATLVWLEVP